MNVRVLPLEIAPMPDRMVVQRRIPKFPDRAHPARCLRPGPYRSRHVSEYARNDLVPHAVIAHVQQARPKSEAQFGNEERLGDRFRTLGQIVFRLRDPFFFGIGHDLIF